MNQKNRSRKSIAKHSARLGAYLAAGLGASTIASHTADAAIVNIIIGPGPGEFNIGGMNGGLSAGTFAQINSFPFTGAGNLRIFNNLNGGIFGLDGQEGLEFAAGSGYASPSNFALNATIDNSASFYDDFRFPLFRYYGTSSANFGPGSYMGFKTSGNRFGWLEVTWDGTDFEILSAAYENTPGVAILAGDTGGSAAVPEPSTWAMSALLAGGVAFTVWRKRRAAAQAKAQAA